MTRPRGLRLGRVRGIPIYLNASWLILAALVMILYVPRVEQELTPTTRYLLAAAFAFCLLLSVLLHEVGHAVAARRFGVRVRSITLELLGGYTEMESDSPSAGADLVVALIGPLVSGVLGAAALGIGVVLPQGSIGSQLALQVAGINLVVAVFNSLPGLPLDGGRALRAVVWAISGNRHTGSRVAGWIGRLVAVATLSVGMLITFVGGSVVSAVIAALVALTLWQGAGSAIVQARVASRLPQINLRQIARPVYPVGAGTSLAEAQRRAAEAGLQQAHLAVTDSSGRVVALVNEEAAAAVPTERRPWVSVETLARALDPGQIISADLAGEALLRAVQARPGPHYLVVSGSDVVGVLRTNDLVYQLSS